MFPFPFGFFYRTPAGVTNTDSAVDPSNLSSYTFTSKSLGAADPTRKIIVAVGLGASSAGVTISSVTVAGSAATSVVSVDSGSGNTRITALYEVSLASGTTGNIVVTPSAGCILCGIAVFRAVNVGSSFNSASSTTISSNAESVSLNIPGDGFAIAAWETGGNTNPRTTTWTNITEVTDALIETNDSLSTACDNFTATQTLTITATASGAMNRAGLVAASWSAA